MGKRNKIVTISKPTLPVDYIFKNNRTGGKFPSGGPLRDTDDKNYGVSAPFVIINGFNVSKILYYFEIDTTGKIPVLNMSFGIPDPVFLSVGYPKDGDIVSVYIRSLVDEYKPLRMDFNILSIQSSTSSDSDGIYQDDSPQIISILAETRIPGLYSEFCKSFPSQSSYEALFRVSEDLGLGFSANEFSTDDRMTWISPNFSYYDFIESVCNRAYKNETSFFEWWIDVYYNLNFVNLNETISFLSNEIDDKILVQPGQGFNLTDGAIPGGTTLKPIEIPLSLTNLVSFKGFPNYITGYTLVSNSGNTTNEIGYIQKVQFFDDSLKTDKQSERYIQYDVSPITSENILPNMVIQRGRPKEDLYKKEVRKRWMGILDYSEGGTHKNFIQSKVQNEINFKDLTKFILQIKTSSFFGGIYRGQSIPIEIYALGGNERFQQVGNEENANENNQSTVRDEFLSGVYVLLGYTIGYTPEDGIHHTLNLCKREWILNSAGDIPKYGPFEIPGFINKIKIPEIKNPFSKK